MGRQFYRLSQFVLRQAFWLGGGVILSGAEQMPDAGPVIVASNHASYLDPPLLGAHLPRPVSFMARKTLFDNIFFGALIRALNAFPLDRDGDSRAALRTFGERLDAGDAVLVFPEGTRTVTGQLQPLKTGVGMLSVRHAAPILPVFVWGSYQSWPKRQAWPRRHRFKILVDTPIAPQTGLRGKEKRHEQARLLETLEARLHALQARAFDGEEAPVPLVLPPPQPSPAGAAQPSSPPPDADERGMS